ncbi:MAG: cytochrome c maturation protein CcmE [Candidatus Rokubacteria bacterium]|nr:cytochrome c maturation protein CcmE [Candidatus Rokubacteria bacterium]
MNRYRKFLIGGGVIALALAGLVVTGLRESVVYFVTPSELRAATGATAGKAYRLGGMVVQGSLRKDLATLDHRFVLSDGKAEVAVHFRGTPPDLFAEGRGAVVEGTVAPDGTFRATTIMAKHSEEYKAPHDAQSGYQELLRTLRRDDARGATPERGPKPPG